MNLYCVMYSEVTNNVWVDGFVVTNDGLVDKEQGDSLRDRAHLPKKREEIKPDKKSDKYSWVLSKFDGIQSWEQNTKNYWLNYELSTATRFFFRKIFRRKIIWRWTK